MRYAHDVDDDYDDFDDDDDWLEREERHDEQLEEQHEHRLDTARGADATEELVELEEDRDDDYAHAAYDYDGDDRDSDDGALASEFSSLHVSIDELIEGQEDMQEFFQEWDNVDDDTEGGLGLL